MPLKRHHKIIIGSFSSFVLIFMIVSSIFVYTLFLKQTVDYKSLNNQISELEADTQGKINLLAESLTQTQKLAEESQETLQLEMSLLKASAGEDFSGIIEDAIKSVVTIRTDVSQGTGFILTDDGYIVTNAHVLADESGYLATGRKAITYEQNIIDAEFIGYDQTLDIALLKIEGSYEKLRLDNSDDIQVGEKVIAIGNPLGLQFSVSDGIVSAVHRTGIQNSEIYIQTTVALNPGNSGGPLINTQGKVIGINGFKIIGGESLGFALESNYIKDSVNDIFSQKFLGEELL